MAVSFHLFHILPPFSVSESPVFQLLGESSPWVSCTPTHLVKICHECKALTIFYHVISQIWVCNEQSWTIRNVSLCVNEEVCLSLDMKIVGSSRSVFLSCEPDNLHVQHPSRLVSHCPCGTWDQGEVTNMPVLMLFVVLTVLKSCVSDPGVLCLLPAPVKQ